MIGVYWDENGKEVEVKEENKSNWYNYEENRWANSKTKDGSYWVWIPRYEYKIAYYTDSNYLNCLLDRGILTLIYVHFYF